MHQSLQSLVHLLSKPFEVIRISKEHRGVRTEVHGRKTSFYSEPGTFRGHMVVCMHVQQGVFID